MLGRIIRGLLMLAVAGIIANTAYDFVCDLFKPEVERSINYTVQVGDSVWGIANKHYPAQTRLSFGDFWCVVEDSIKAQNNGSTIIHPGQRYVITWKHKI